MPDYVLFDKITWSTGTRGSTTEATFQYHELKRGDEVPADLPPEHLARFQEAGAIGTEEELRQAERRLAGPPVIAADGTVIGGQQGTGPASDDDLREMSASDLTAYLNQHNDEADRVEALENERDKPRKSVLEAVDSLREAQDNSNG